MREPTLWSSELDGHLKACSLVLEEGQPPPSRLRSTTQHHWGKAYPSDVLERPYTAGEGGGVTPSWTPPPILLPFQCLRLTAKKLLRRFRCQDDLSFKIFGPPSSGTIGGPWEEGVPAKPPLRSPPPPLIHPWGTPPPPPALTLEPSTHRPTPS